jgi:DNA-binding response OmpR family regulator
MFDGPGLAPAKFNHRSIMVMFPKGPPDLDPPSEEGPADSVIRALLIEDDERLARLTARYLQGHGVVVSVVADGIQGLGEALRGQHDIILLDLMLPGRDGIEVCRQIRSRSDVPIIMVTARGEEVDRVLGLELGADDYLAKPFSSRELLARIRAQVRRARGQAGPSLHPVRVGGLLVDPRALRVTLDGRELPLTAYEFALLKALAERAGRVLSRERLLDLAKGSAEEAFDRSIDVHISRLRQKLGDDPKQPRLLKTVRGAGYVLALEGGQ